MANIKNLKRIGQIAKTLPQLEEARKLLADTTTEVRIEQPGMLLPCGEYEKDKCITLPQELKYNIVNILNLEINKLKEELKEL
jgi:hypothetical protein